MKLRLAWLADAEDVDSYSAAESRVLLRAIARRAGVVPLWLAVGSTEPPHWWNGIRVFPVPSECLASATFLKTLIDQQRPNVVVSNIPRSRFPAGMDLLGSASAKWIHRVNPEDSGKPRDSKSSLTLVGDVRSETNSDETVSLPYLWRSEGMDPATADPSTVLHRLAEAVLTQEALGTAGASRHPVQILMRQQLFCNTSLAQVMFELTNALIELGLPAIAQDEHPFFSKDFIGREEDLLREGAPDKYHRVLASLNKEFDPENSVTVHFALFKPGTRHSRNGVFPALAGREMLYTTGNHAVAPAHIRALTESFEKILAPSTHVLKSYLEAGLARSRGAVIPHGIDPSVLSPECAPLPYPTNKGFKFLQTSFPWVYEKGFDLTIRAFCMAFSSRDDVSLILRVPCIQRSSERAGTITRLERLVKEASGKPGAPEIVLLEMDLPPNRRGGGYTAADCYVHPLRAEGFGMTILEAMACGLPVIATPWSGPADFLSPRHAYLLRHSNPVPERTRNGALLRHHVEPELDHLIELMRHAYRDRNQALALGRRAADVVRLKWTWRAAASRLGVVLGFTNLTALDQNEPYTR